MLEDVPLPEAELPGRRPNRQEGVCLLRVTISMEDQLGYVECCQAIPSEE